MPAVPFLSPRLELPEVDVAEARCAWEGCEATPSRAVVLGAWLHLGELELERPMECELACRLHARALEVRAGDAWLGTFRWPPK
jgi:hypothetical protein